MMATPPVAATIVPIALIGGGIAPVGPSSHTIMGEASMARKCRALRRTINMVGLARCGSFGSRRECGGCRTTLRTTVASGLGADDFTLCRSRRVIALRSMRCCRGPEAQVAS
jgi:hypothetical protein